jgi:hypothetical protein
MTTFSVRFGDLDPDFRRAALWLAILVAGLVVCTVADDAGFALITFAFVPLFAIATVSLIVAGLMSSWRHRRRGVRAIAAAVMPFAAIAIGAIAFTAAWSIRGVPPPMAAGTADYQIGQVLTSPDRELRAVVLWDLSGGPMTGASQDVYIEREPTSFFRYRDRVFAMECIQHFAARWSGPGTLTISYTVGQDALGDDGVERSSVWLGASAVRQVKIVVVRNLVPQPSLC